MEFVEVLESDFRAMSKVPDRAKDAICQRIRVAAFDGLLAWAQGLMRLELTDEVRLLHSFILTELGTRHFNMTVSAMGDDS